MADGGTEESGTGDAAILARTTAEEAAAAIGALDAALAQTHAEGGAVRLIATGTGGASSLVVGDGTANAELGFTHTQSDYGDIGLGIGCGMADDEYSVLVTLVTDSPGGGVSVHDKQAGSFDVYQESPAAVPAEVIVVGALAE